MIGHLSSAQTIQVSVVLARQVCYTVRRPRHPSSGPLLCRPARMRQLST